MLILVARFVLERLQQGPGSPRRFRRREKEKKNAVRRTPSGDASKSGSYAGSDTILEHVSTS